MQVFSHKKCHENCFLLRNKSSDRQLIEEVISRCWVHVLHSSFALRFAPNHLDFLKKILEHIAGHIPEKQKKVNSCYISPTHTCTFRSGTIGHFGYVRAVPALARIPLAENLPPVALNFSYQTKASHLKMETRQAREINKLINGLVDLIEARDRNNPAYMRFCWSLSLPKLFALTKRRLNAALPWKLAKFILAHNTKAYSMNLILQV